MEKIEKDVNKIIKKIKNKYGNSSDINDRIINIKGIKVGCIFLESSSQTSTISDFIIKSIVYIEKDKNIFNSILKLLENKLFNCQLFTIDNFEDFPYYLSSGFTIIIIFPFSSSWQAISGLSLLFICGKIDFCFVK